MMPPAFDVLIAGGGPAGAVAALVLARAGARVAVFERARFPRDKLCGDTINPGALAVLRRLGVDGAAGAFPIDGMLVTGERGVRIAGRYPAGISGRAILRRDFDQALLTAAAAAGADVREEALVQATTAIGGIVNGITVGRSRGAWERVAARVVIAADGGRSRLATGLRLARHPRAPRRWAIGAYFTDVRGLTTCGEMHIRRHKYIGVAPLPRGLANVCVVTADRAALRRPLALLMDSLRTEPELTDRFAGARLAGAPAILGPLAVESRGAGVPGLLLAGDAAGFIDPMTGDGLRFALRGGELAALEALRALDQGFGSAHLRLHQRRSREFRAKWRFNRALRRVAGSPSGVRVAAAAAALLPAYVEHAIRYAGDLRT